MVKKDTQLEGFITKKPAAKKNGEPKPYACHLHGSL